MSKGEKNTKYFFGLEKSRYNAKTCYRLITEEGHELEDQDEILKEQRKYYQELYQEDEYVDFKYEQYFWGICARSGSAKTKCTS